MCFLIQFNSQVACYILKFLSKNMDCEPYVDRLSLSKKCHMLYEQFVWMVTWISVCILCSFLDCVMSDLNTVCISGYSFVVTFIFIWNSVSFYTTWTQPHQNIIRPDAQRGLQPHAGIATVGSITGFYTYSFFAEHDMPLICYWCDSWLCLLYFEAFHTAFLQSVTSFIPTKCT